jgi:hypothetical protein
VVVVVAVGLGAAAREDEHEDDDGAAEDKGAGYDDANEGTKGDGWGGGGLGLGLGRKCWVMLVEGGHRGGGFLLPGDCWLWDCEIGQFVCVFAMASNRDCSMHEALIVQYIGVVPRSGAGKFVGDG